MIKVILPKYFNLVVGDTFQLFYRGCIEAPNPYVYDILAICEKGRNCPRYFEFTPDEDGDYPLTIYVYNENKELLGKGETILRARVAKEPKKPITILCMGDSGTQNGDWPHEADRRLTAEGGEPCGLGLKNIQFVGTKEKEGTAYEGYGGWVFKTYITKDPTGAWFTCAHNIDEGDQHSTWQDENGKLWKLETITKKKLKLLRLDKSDRTLPRIGSVLTHVANATHKEPLTIEKCIDEAKTPFYNEEVGTLDFEWYKKKCGFENADYIYVLLGGNEVADSPVPVDLSNSESMQNIVKRTVANAKEFIRAMRKAFPGVKIKLMGLLVPSLNGGTGVSYGAKPPYCDKFGYTKFVFELNLAYEALSYEEEYRDYVEFINMSAQFDSENGYPEIEKPVNVRIKKTETVGTNGLHPTHEGYLMMADAAFRNMACLEDGKEIL